MPASPRRRRSEELALLALLGASVGAAAWLASRWRERAQRWQQAREASRGLALQSSHPLPIEDEAEYRNGHHHNGHQNIFLS
jgi:ferric-dicitrate binding protein FerR (iron transport regulator)